MNTDSAKSSKKFEKIGVLAIIAQKYQKITEKTPELLNFTVIRPQKQKSPRRLRTGGTLKHSLQPQLLPQPALHPSEYHIGLATPRRRAVMTMFSHLLQPEFGVFDTDPPPPAEFTVAPDAPATSLDDATPLELVNAQANTVDWLEAVGAHTQDPPQDPTTEEAARSAARAAFCSVTDPYQDPLRAKAALMTLRAPPAVRHLAGMLTQYDWNYVEQAKEIRGFVVARLIEHARSPEPKTSLPALKALGTVTEVGVFTERVEITRPPGENTTDAIVARLRERLTKLLPPEPKPQIIEDAVIVTPDTPGA